MSFQILTKRVNIYADLCDLAVKFTERSRELNIIFVADIFGVTDEFKCLCQQVTFEVEQKLSITCQLHMIGPYQQQAKSFSSEHDAYQHFMKNVTLIGYVEKLEKKLSTISGNKLLVGFSVGGSAIWQLGSERTIEHSLGAFCFYSSQIRQMTKLTPKIPTRLIFPATEAHFSLAELRVALQDKSGVTIEQSEYLHGFMNPLSMNYDQQAYLHFINRLAELLSEQYAPESQLKNV